MVKLLRDVVGTSRAPKPLKTKPPVNDHKTGSDEKEMMDTMTTGVQHDDPWGNDYNKGIKKDDSEKPNGGLTDPMKKIKEAIEEAADELNDEDFDLFLEEAGIDEEMLDELFDLTEISQKHLKPGDVVTHGYNHGGNQNRWHGEFKGYTDHKDPYSEKHAFKTLKDVHAHYGTKNEHELEAHPEGKKVHGIWSEKGDHYHTYLHKGKWSIGSSADKQILKHKDAHIDESVELDEMAYNRSKDVGDDPRSKEQIATAKHVNKALGGSHVDVSHSRQGGIEIKSKLHGKEGNNKHVRQMSVHLHSIGVPHRMENSGMRRHGDQLYITSGDAHEHGKKLSEKGV